MKDKLKVKIWNYKNVVLFEVLEQSDNLRGKDLLFTASNGIKVYSCDYPDMYGQEIYIRGDEQGTDEIVANLSCYSTKQAKRFVKKVKQAVKEFNEALNPILTDEEKEYLRGVINPFRSNGESNPFKHKILSIKKIGWEQNLAYIEKIIIDIEDDDEMIFPIFQGNTMYKGMKLDKEYTLEELGL